MAKTNNKITSLIMAIVLATVLTVLAYLVYFPTLSHVSEAATVTVIGDGQIYYIRNVSSGLYLDVSGGNTGNGTSVQQWHGNKTNSQRWRTVYNKDGTYCLEPLNASGKRLQNSSGKGVINQDNNDSTKFFLTHVPNGYFKIVPKTATGNVMAVQNTNVGNQIQSIGYNSNNPKHLWTFENENIPTVSIINGGVYFIKNVGSGLYLDVRNGNTGNGTAVQQYTFNATNSQKWRAVYNNDNTYCLEPLNAPDSRLWTDNWVGKITKNNNDQTKFYLQYEYNGEFRIGMKWSPDSVFIAPNNSSGTQITETNYSTDITRYRWFFELAESNDTVAEFSVFSAHGGSSSAIFSDMGHSWIIIENKTSSNIKTGKMTIMPGQSVSIGKFAKDPRWGIWYNIEAYHPSWFNDKASLTMSISASQLTTINKYILGNDGYNLFDNNCSTLAWKAWNSVAPSNKQVTAWNFWTIYHYPSILKESILDKGGQTNKTISFNPNIGYYDGNIFVSNDAGGGSSSSSFSTPLEYEYYNAYYTAYGLDREAS